jgi:hypothetical protein
MSKDQLEGLLLFLAARTRLVTHSNRYPARLTISPLKLEPAELSLDRRTAAVAVFEPSGCRRRPSAPSGVLHGIATGLRGANRRDMRLEQPIRAALGLRNLSAV